MAVARYVECGKSADTMPRKAIIHQSGRIHAVCVEVTTPSCGISSVR